MTNATQTQTQADITATTSFGNVVLNLLHADLVVRPSVGKLNDFGVSAFNAGDPDKAGDRMWRNGTIAYVNHINGVFEAGLAEADKSFTGSTLKQYRTHLKSAVHIEIQGQQSKAQLQDEVAALRAQLDKALRNTGAVNAKPAKLDK